MFKLNPGLLSELIKLDPQRLRLNARHPGGLDLLAQRLVCGPSSLEALFGTKTRAPTPAALLGRGRCAHEAPPLDEHARG